MRLAALLLALTTLLGFVGAQAQDGRSDAELAAIGRAVSGYIVPNTERFQEVAEDGRDRIAVLCNAPSETALSSARNGFSDMARMHARIVFLRFGPLKREDRGERLLFWPDRRGIGLRQIQAALADENPAMADPSSLSTQSVAVQGLGALEYLLFGNGSDTLADPSAPAFRCRFALAVATNIAGIARDLAKDWTDPDGFAAIWQHPSADNPAYRDANESLSELIAAMSDAFALLRDTQLVPIHPVDGDKINPKRALFWRSGETFNVIAAQLDGLKTLLSVADPSDLYPQDLRWLAGSLMGVYANAEQVLGALGTDADVETVIAGQQDEITQLLILTRTLQRMIGQQVAGALGLSTGFSPLDGD